MHVTKFKVDDVIHNNEYGNYIIKKIKDSGYEVIKESTNEIGFIYYLQEHIWCLVTSNNKHCDVSKSSNVGVCPRCQGKLKDHMSYALGEMIKKCGNCGWC